MDIASQRALEQIALRQDRRRHFNERLAALDPAAESARFRCECGLIACGMALRLTAEEYAGLRTHTRQLAVHPGHVLPGADRVVAAHAGWVTIEASGHTERETVETAAAPVERHR